jgi:hypothetical protein
VCLSPFKLLNELIHPIFELFSSVPTRRTCLTYFMGLCKTEFVFVYVGLCVGDRVTNSKSSIKIFSRRRLPQTSNGRRLQVKHFWKNIINATTFTGYAIGEVVFISRIGLNPVIRPPFFKNRYC